MGAVVAGAVVAGAWRGAVPVVPEGRVPGGNSVVRHGETKCNWDDPGGIGDKSVVRGKVVGEAIKLGDLQAFVMRDEGARHHAKGVREKNVMNSTPYQ
jgi:hypothetical protein